MWQPLLVGWKVFFVFCLMMNMLQNASNHLFLAKILCFPYTYCNVTSMIPHFSIQYGWKSINSYIMNCISDLWGVVIVVRYKQCNHRSLLLADCIKNISLYTCFLIIFGIWRFHYFVSNRRFVSSLWQCAKT